MNCVAAIAAICTAGKLGTRKPDCAPLNGRMRRSLQLFDCLLVEKRADLAYQGF